MPTEPSIDAVQLQRDIREKMSREMEGMSTEEILLYLNEGHPKHEDQSPLPEKHAVA
ncbi:hypothetical protein [Longimicrobium sp.]|jgi:hypothetical protein|uniref:hypothetical protein n=1 Tax=Longimicrobium sp. TaxID=2029185 RepID=UPI002ED81E0D